LRVGQHVSGPVSYFAVDLDDMARCTGADCRRSLQLFFGDGGDGGHRKLGVDVDRLVEELSGVIALLRIFGVVVGDEFLKRWR
jgi:hypothetical protein